MRVIFCSVPSILRNSRYRRDQRQMEDEEEMWFNEDDEFDDNEAIVPTATDILAKKLDTDLDSITKMVKKETEARMNNNSTPKTTVLSNSATTGPTTPTPATAEKSALFKRVNMCGFFNSIYCRVYIPSLFECYSKTVNTRHARRFRAQVGLKCLAI